MSIELTVLGCSGSFPSPASGPCSGYLVRAGGTAVWMECGSGSFERLQRHAVVEDIAAVVITHRHADHCTDLLGFEMLLKYYRGIESGPPVLAPAGVCDALAAVSAPIADYFAWDEVGDGDRRVIGDLAFRFSRTDHPPPTVAVEASSGGKRIVYTADTGPKWSPEAFGERPDLLLAEATYLVESPGHPFHLTATQAGAMAGAVGARRLILTHLGPLVDPAESVADAQAALGGAVTLAAPHLRVRI